MADTLAASTRRGALLLATVLFAACGGTGDVAVPAAANSEGARTATSEAARGSGEDGGDRALGDPPAEPQHRPYRGPLTYEWPVGCSLPVVESVDRRGTQAELAYELDIRALGDLVEVSYLGMRVVSLDGRTPTTEENEFLSTSLSLPSFVVDGGGVGVGLRGVDEMLQQMQRIDPRLTEIPPGFVAALEETVLTKYWGTWVGFWVDFGDIEIDRWEGASELVVGDRVVVAPLVVEAGPIGADGLIRLRAEQTVSDSDLAGLLAATLDQFGGDVADVELRGDRTTTFEVLTDPTTLRPVTAQQTVSLTAEIDDEQMDQHESRSWSFDWSGSDCVG